MIDSDKEILGDLPERITAPPKVDKTIIPDNLPRGGVEGVKPVKLRELPPMPSDYRLKRTSHKTYAWWALPYGLYLYLRSRWRLIAAGAFFMVVVPVACALVEG